MQKVSAFPQKNPVHPVHPVQNLPELSEIIMEINDLHGFVKLLA
jgi:hypothetical protein